MKSCPILLALVSASLFLSCQRDPVAPKPVEINYHFATITEGQQRLLANTEYYNRLTQNDLDWKARKTGATLDELKAIGQASVLDFSEEDKAVIDEAVGYIEGGRLFRFQPEGPGSYRRTGHLVPLRGSL